MHFVSIRAAICLAVIGVFAAPSVASAEDFANLTKNGYAVGKITRGKSGQIGWTLKKAGKTYFCPARLSSVYVDNKTMYLFMASGNKIEGDRKTFDDRIGGPDPNIPYWKDLQAGRVNPRNVKPCAPAS
jgi:hypothetical protein